MGFVQDIIDGIVGAFTDLIIGLLDILIITPLENFVAGLMGFLQEVIVGTPYPRRETGQPYPAVMQEPANQPWELLYNIHEGIFQPYAYLLLFITILTVVFIEVVGSAVNVDSFKADLEHAKGKFFSGFLLITFWWYLGTLVLAASDALTSLLMSAVNSGGGDQPDSPGLVAIWETAVEQISGEGGSSDASADDNPADGSNMSRLLMIPLILVWLCEALLLLIIALLWVLRMFVIFVMMPVMPIFIALWVMHLPGFGQIQEIGADAMKWFVSLAFITLPAAIVVAVSGRIIEDVLSFGTSAITGQTGDNSGQLRGYDRTELISHPQVGETVYGDGVSGLGTTQPQLGAIAGIGAILFAILIVVAVPILAGLAPFLLYRSEVGTLAAGAINPAAGVASAAADVKDSVQSSSQKARRVGSYARQRNFEDMQEEFMENVEGDDVGARMKNNPMALFGATTAKMAGRTQDTASQMKAGAGRARNEVPARAMSGMARVDNAQRMIREHRGELTDIGVQNAREKAKKTIDPAKQQARMQSLAQKPGDVRESFQEQVAEQKNSIDARLENRRERHQRLADMSPAEIRAQYESKAYTPDEDSLDTLLANDGSVISASSKSGMLNEIEGLREKGKEDADLAVSAMNMMENSVRDGLEGSDINPDPYVDEIQTYREQVMRGEMSPEEAMQALGSMQNRIEDEVLSDEEVKQKYQQMEDNYEKFGANMSQGEFAAQSMSSMELNNMPELQEVIGGFAMRENRMQKALRDAGLEDMASNQDKLEEFKENPQKLASMIGASSFNENNVSDKFEAKESLDLEQAASSTHLDRSELQEMSIDEVHNAIEQKFEEDGEYNGIKSMQNLGALKQQMVQTEVVAEQAYAQQMMREMVENAPSKEAAITLLESQQGALLEQADGDIDDLKGLMDVDEVGRGEIVADIEQSDIVSDLIEQELNGEEIQSDISERFHEEFESTEAMLENIGEVREARDIVSTLEEDIEGVSDESVMEVGGESVTLKEMVENPESVGERLAGVKLDQLEAANDTETLEQFGVEVEGDAITPEEVQEKKTERINEAINSVEEQIQNEFEQTQSELEESFGADIDMESRIQKAKDEVGGEVTSENLNEFIQQVGKQKKTAELEAKFGSKVRGKEGEKATPEATVDE